MKEKERIYTVTVCDENGDVIFDMELECNKHVSVRQACADALATAHHGCIDD